MAELVSVDKSGRLVLPKRIRKKLGLEQGGVVALELRGSGLAIERISAEKSAAKAISKMHLPIGPWEKTEKEIAKGISTE